MKCRMEYGVVVEFLITLFTFNTRDNVAPVKKKWQKKRKNRSHFKRNSETVSGQIGAEEIAIHVHKIE